MILLVLLPCARAEERFPKPDWKPAPNPMASPHAVPGGEIVIYGHQYPKSFNYYLDDNSFVAEVFGTLYETLVTRNSLTLDYEPALAESWTISDDKRTFTFRLNPKAKWSDGTPITAADVRWTFDAITNMDNLTGPHKVALEVFDTPVVVNEREIRFTARQVHWRNLDAVGGFSILPRHLLATQDFNKVNFDFPVVSGPYRLGEVRENVSVTLQRRSDWWQRSSPASQGVANFERIRYKFFAERENAFEAFKKGEIDVYPVYTANLWVNKTSGEKFDRNWIAKQRIYNYNPIGFQGFAMNMRRFPFDDICVRQALAHTLDREKMNRTLMYDQYFLHRSFYEDLYSKTNPCPNEPMPFSKEKARRLLADAGWAVNPKTGVLEKNGQSLRFRFLAREATEDKFLAIFAEDLKDLGIAMTIEHKDLAAWQKDMDEFNYEMTWAAWGSGVFKDPEYSWSSREARRQGNNITGFTNAMVDALIERQKTLYDVQARHAICREIDQLVVREHPYILLWNNNYSRLLFWNKFGMPSTVFAKYDNESCIPWLWWSDEDSTAELQDAMRQGSALPARKAAVAFDDEYKPPR